MRELIIRLPNWVGDVIMCLPALDQLHQQGIKLIVVGKPWIHDLLKDMPYELHTFDDHHSLKSIPCERVLLFTNSFSSALKARLAKKKCLGYATDARRLLLHKSIQKPKKVHETRVFLMLAQEALTYYFGLSAQTLADDDAPPKLSITAFSNKAYPKPPYVVLCPFAHGRTRDNKIKKWPYWQALAKEMAHLNPIICPGPNEIIEAKLHFPHVHMLDGLSLYEYAQVLSQARLVIANDSGPMHIAAALNTPTIGIFGVTDPKRTAPKTAIILGNTDEWPSLELVLARAKPFIESINSN